MHDRELPKKAVKEEEFIKIKTLNISNNPIEVVEFKDIKNEQGTPQIGYFKKVNIEKGLPETLCKLSVAISSFLRPSKAKGVAEERLVYDKDHNIIGTISFELLGFVQFQGGKDENLKDKKQQELANPTPETILKSGFIEKMVKGLIHHNYDFGPHNCGVHWLLDFEYFFPELTSIFKGERFNINIKLLGYEFHLLDPIDKVIELTPEILRTFKTRLPYFPGESPKNHVSKREFKTTAFKELLENEKYIPEAIYQRYQAYLEELVLFDREAIRQRLVEYLGDEKLNLAQLPIEQQMALKKLEQTHYPNLLLDEDNKERSLVDFFLTIISYRHEKFRRVLIDMPELREHFAKLKKPSQFEFLEKENKNAFSRYQSILRDSFKLPILNHINTLKEVASKEVGFCVITEKIQMDLTVSYPNTEITLSYPKNTFKGQTNELKTVIHNLLDLFQSHYALKKPSANQNKRFLEKITNTLTVLKNKTEQFEKMLSEKKINIFALSEITNMLTKLNKTVINFNQILIDFKQALSSVEKYVTPTKELPVDKTKAATPKTVLQQLAEKKEEEPIVISPEEERESRLATDDVLLIEHLIKILWLWRSVNTTSIMPIIKKSYDEYSQNASYGGFFSRTCSSCNLAEIFSTGGWANNSLNTLLIKNICLQAAGTTTSLKTILINKNKNWWAQHAKKIAIDSHLYDAHQPKGLSKSALR